MLTPEKLGRGVLAMGVLGFVAGIANTLRVLEGVGPRLGECRSRPDFPCLVPVTLDWQGLALFGGVHAIVFAVIFVAVVPVAATVWFVWRHLSQPSQTG
jgi:hypothetical protein